MEDLLHRPPSADRNRVETELEGARRRAEFLAEAGRLLTASLDYQATLSSVARLVVPRLADWCAVLVVEDGRIEPVAVAHVDESKVEFARRLQERYPVDPGADMGTARVLRTGRTELYPEIDEAMLAAGARDEEHLRLLRELRLGAAVVVPLTSHSHTFGAITLAVERGRTMTPDDVRLAEDLARSAALAIANAQLFREAQMQKALLVQQAEASIDGVLAVDPDGTILMHNRRFAQMWGIPEDVLSARSDDAAIEAVRDRVVDPDEFTRKIRFLYENPTLTSRDELMLSDGRTFDRWSAPLRLPDGTPIGRAWYFRDVTEQKRLQTDLQESTRRANFLAEAATRIAAAPDPASAARDLAEISVEHVADWCLVDLVDDSGRMYRAAAAASEPWDGSGHDGMIGPDAWRPATVAEAAELRTPRAQSAVPAPPVAGRSPDPVSTLSVPLAGRDTTLGVLTWIVEGRDFVDRERALAAELAARTAPALESLRLHRERSHIARTLAQGLVPSRLPSVPGIEMGARYRTAVEATAIGGDFYDVFNIGPRSWALVVGDVCGKGARAATLTALARYTLRAAALRARKPRRILSTLNELLLHEDVGDRFCTAVYARVELGDDGARATFCAAGVPLPILRRADGATSAIGTPGTALGVSETPRLVDVSVTLGPGDMLAMLTDGFTEARSGGDTLGEERLLDICATSPGDSADAWAGGIEEQVLAFTGGKCSDDMALLVVRALP